MNKKPNFKSLDNETSRSILKSNSPRPIHNSTSPPKTGIFKRTSLYEGKSVNDVLSTSIRETMSESIIPDMDNIKGIIRAKPPEKQAKKVQFLDSPTKSDDYKQFECLLNDKTADDSEFRDLLKSAIDSSLAQVIDDKTDSLLDLLSDIPTVISPREDSLRHNIHLLSKMTSVERIFVMMLIILFFTMIVKHFRTDWFEPSTVKSPLTGSQIVSLMGRNVKRMCKNIVSLGGYFW